ncbi:MAG TPA: TetR/AcrR family transcriptional regulator [Anaeromyxobacteraceae bacterium]|nr:TetR/AcrR family transcriptional regulator [Anaeromyxobacteraceae bacterium]
MPRPRTTAARAAPAPEASEPEKRRAILHAAVRVFAEKGYHGCRIADVARAAGVAYGLVYHYFRNKDELLESVFAEQWAILLNALRAIDAGAGSAAEKVAGVVAFVFDVYRTAPAAVRVLLLEVSHTPNALRAGSTRETFDTAAQTVAGVVRQGQERGEFRSDADPLVAAIAILGAMELALSGLLVGVIGAPAPGEEQVERVKRQVVAFALAGLRKQALTGGGPPGT